MRVFVVVLMLVLMSVTMAYSEDTKKDSFHDWFAFTELQAGGLWSFEREEFMPYFALPTVGYRKAALVLGGEFDLDAIGDGPTAGILGVTFYLGNVKDWGVDIPGAQYFGVNFGPVLRYDFDTGAKEVGLVLSILDVSQSEGNQKKQKER